MESAINPAPETVSVAPFKLSWREKYAGILVLLMGLAYLALFVTDFMSTTHTGYASKEGKLQIDIHELQNHVRGVVIILLCIIGSWLLFLMKRTGWVISMALILLLTIIAGGYVAWNYKILPPAGRGIALGGIGLLVLAILFLLLPSARKKYKVGKLTFLPTLLLLAVLAALFILQ